MQRNIAWKKLAILALLLILAVYINTSRQTTEAHKAYSENNYLFSTKNNDIAIYVPSAYKDKYQYYDAGKGHDTIWLKISLKDFYSPLFQADLIRFYYYLLLYTDQSSIAGTGPSFHFQKFNLRIRNFESLVIEQIEAKFNDITESSDALKDSIPLYDTRIDSLS